MHTRQKLLLLKTLQGINQRKYKFRKRTKMLLLIHHEFILKKSLEPLFLILWFENISFMLFLHLLLILKGQKSRGNICSKRNFTQISRNLLLRKIKFFPSLRSKKIFDYITPFKFRLPSIITPFIFAPFAPSIRPFSFRSLWRKLKVDKNWRPTTINPIYSNPKCKIVIIIIITSLQQFH